MTRNECINKASSYIKEVAYENPNQFTKWFWKDNQAHAWCGAFVDYVVKHDLGCNWLDSCSNFGGCGSIVEWAKKMGYWYTDYTKAKKGDLVIFNWYPEKKNHYSHIGIVNYQISNGLKTVEGNTSYGEYKANCVANKSRNKKYIAGVILLPYKEEEMEFKVGDYVYAKEDIKLYTTIEYKESKYTLKKGEKAYVRLIKGNNIALANPNTKEYFVSAWTNQLDKLTKDDPTDYKKLYEEEVAKNKILTDENTNLKNKINKAILDLQ